MDDSDMRTIDVILSLRSQLHRLRDSERKLKKKLEKSAEEISSLKMINRGLINESENADVISMLQEQIETKKYSEDVKEEEMSKLKAENLRNLKIF